MKEYNVKVYSNGDTEWFLNSKRHREDGHAIECNNGYRAWYIKGERHREDGPAIERSNGSKEWYLNGKLHREDGPAIEYGNGNKSWYLNGKKLTESEFNKRTSTCNGRIVEVDGVKYTLKKV